MNTALVVGVVVTAGVGYYLLTSGAKGTTPTRPLIAKASEAPLFTEEEIQRRSKQRIKAMQDIGLDGEVNEYGFYKIKAKSKKERKEEANKTTKRLKKRKKESGEKRKGGGRRRR